MRLLLVEDDLMMLEALQTGLRRQGLAVDTATDGLSAVDMVLTNDYDVILLDRDIPGMHGDAVCAVIVENRPQCRIMMVTAAGRLSDRVTGLRIGSDDYLIKPFDLPELYARIHALMRRGVQALPPVLRCGDLTLDPSRRRVDRAGEPVNLAPKEFAVLELLIRSDGATVSAETLLEKAWDAYADPFTNAVRITVSTLRRKLGDPPIIKTVVGVGYRIDSR
ncbi:MULTISPECIES: response regulator transcription factor [unclassified Pseudonocardia]|uniref:response regulator transcription factor n=1 Tax=unclassified Pseudonocardia TaxID=2619320 RepID=UPI000705B97B|nr:MULTISPECIES: response regulator transcription factor [unclassified Pseudonocardia]ALL85847.1 transcriptional regulator [Pseudonocardia sp. EC080619-01]